MLCEFGPSDWPDVSRIYAEGIASANATFETELPTWERWNASHHPFCRFALRRDGEIAGWASLSPVSTRACYLGVAEVSVYVSEIFRGQGIGKTLLLAVIEESPPHRIWTLQGVTFPENTASINLQLSCGFRLVGRREAIAQLNGVWRDTVLLERRIPR